MRSQDGPRALYSLTLLSLSPSGGTAGNRQLGMRAVLAWQATSLGPVLSFSAAEGPWLGALSLGCAPELCAWLLSVCSHGFTVAPAVLSGGP